MAGDNAMPPSVKFTLYLLNLIEYIRFFCHAVFLRVCEIPEGKQGRAIPSAVTISHLGCASPAPHRQRWTARAHLSPLLATNGSALYILSWRH